MVSEPSLVEGKATAIKRFKIEIYLYEKKKKFFDQQSK